MDGLSRSHSPLDPLELALPVLAVLLPVVASVVASVCAVGVASLVVMRLPRWPVVACALAVSPLTGPLARWVALNLL